MKKYPNRRAGLTTAGARARQRPAEVHEGSPDDFLRRHEREAAEAAHGNASQKRIFCSRALPRVADSRNVFVAIQHEIHKRGRSTTHGVSNLDRDEVWSLCRALGKAIQSDAYRPALVRQEKIAKSPTATRTLTIPDPIDRIVERAIVQIIQPFIDSIFDDHSLGFRPNRDRRDALALTEKIAKDESRWTWISDDLRDAFDHVPRRRLLDIVRLYLQDEKILQLIDRVTAAKGKKGLKQGGNLSPLLLNLFLHHLLDRKWRERNPNTPLIRVADDLLILCTDADEAKQAFQALKLMLREAGMPSKGSATNSIHEVGKGKAVTWLGFLLTKQEQELKVKVAEKTWRKLEEKLALAHQKPESPLRAIETINGWIRQQGPARPKADEGEPYARITHMAMTQAFEEIPSKEEMSQEWERAHAEWIKHRERVTTQESGNRGGSACRQAKNQGESVLNGEARARRASPNLCPTLELTIFTDGSCLPDQRVGGWAYIIKDTSGSRIESRSGSSPFTTNNRMELMAAIRALECVREPATIRIVTDSAYLARGLNEWLPRWRMQGMRAGSRHQRRRLANFDLWDRIAEFVDRHRVSCEWIQSHSGRAENEECDCMARHAAEQQGDLAVDRRQNQ